MISKCTPSKWGHPLRDPPWDRAPREPPSNRGQPPECSPTQLGNLILGEGPGPSIHHQKWRLQYEFYEKHLASKHCILETSATSWNRKKATLSQKVIRKLHNTSEKTEEVVNNRILDTFGQN